MGPPPRFPMRPPSPPRPAVAAPILVLGTALAAAFAAAAAGCHDLPRDLDRAMEERQGAFAEAAAVAAERRPAVRVAWPQAVELMARCNPELARARLDCANARRDTRRVYEGLLPYLNLSLGSNGRLGDPDLFSWRRISYDFYLTEYLDRFLDLPRDLYAAGLREARCELAWSLALKQHLLALHLAVLSQARAEAAHAELAGRLDFIRRHPSAFTPRDFREAEDADIEAAAQVRAAGAALRSVLGVSHEDVRVDAAGLPDWAGRGEALRQACADPARPAFAPDRTVLALQAVELVGLDARRRDIHLGYWPDLSLYLSPPSLGGRLGDDRPRSFRLEDTTASATLNWRPLDALRVRDQLERLGPQRSLVLADFARAHDEMLRERGTRAAELADFERLAERLRERLRVAEKLLPVQPFEQAPSAGAEIAQLKTRLAELEHRRRVRLVEFWFLSDNQEELLKEVPVDKP